MRTPLPPPLLLQTGIIVLLVPAALVPAYLQDGRFVLLILPTIYRRSHGISTNSHSNGKVNFSNALNFFFGHSSGPTKQRRHISVSGNRHIFIIAHHFSNDPSRLVYKNVNTIRGAAAETATTFLIFFFFYPPPPQRQHFFYYPPPHIFSYNSWWRI